MNPSYSMNRNTSLRGVFALVLASLLLGAAVVLTASAFADSSQGHRHDGAHGHKGHHGQGQDKPKMYVFRGTYNAADGSVNVTGGNKRVRKHNLVGTIVQFDYTNAKFSVIDGPDVDTVGNEQADVQPNDRVLVQAKLGNQDPGVQPFKAKRLNDLSNPPADDGPDA